MAFTANDLVSEQRNSKACGRIKAHSPIRPAAGRTITFVPLKGSQASAWYDRGAPSGPRGRARRITNPSGRRTDHYDFAMLVDSVRRAMERLLLAAPAVLAALARGFAAARKDRHPPGPAAMARWPAEVLAVAPRLYCVGIPAHRLPIFGPWLFRDVTPSLQLAGVLSTRAFRALGLATRTIRAAAGDTSNFGTHSVRRGAAATLFLPACRVPSSRRRCGTPPRGRTSRTSQSQLS